MSLPGKLERPRPTVHCRKCGEDASMWLEGKHGICLSLFNCTAANSTPWHVSARDTKTDLKFASLIKKGYRTKNRPKQKILIWHRLCLMLNFASPTETNGT
jgi:hypothetical protein